MSTEKDGTPAWDLRDKKHPFTPGVLVSPRHVLGVGSYRVLVSLVFLVPFVAILLLQGIVWTRSLPDTPLEAVLIFLTVPWSLQLLSAIPGLIGLFLYRPERPRFVPLRPFDKLVCYRVVSRGHNLTALRQTVQSIRAEMQHLPLFPYRIEVVTDLEVDPGRGDDLVHLVVPKSYRTPNGTRYKARALQYALEHSDLPDDAWIMHLDEESHVSPQVIRGIQNAVAEEEQSGGHRIGQGTILYYRTLRGHPFFTLADSIRTGDDLGRFHLQHRLGVTLFGLHGSFILVRNSLEQAIGFDLGPAGSVTEDAFWALLAMDRGYRCRWVDGYVVEQAPRSVWDFLKQRRRWFLGLVLAVRHAPVAVRYRLVLGLAVAVWAVSWVGIFYAWVNLVLGLSSWWPVQVTGDLGWAFYIVLYVIGLKLNLDDHGEIGWLRRVVYYAAQVMLIPVFALLEGAGVLYGIIRPTFDYHVIRK